MSFRHPQFYLRARAAGAESLYGAPARGSPLVRVVDRAFAHLGLDVVTYQYLVGVGYPDRPVQTSDRRGGARQVAGRRLRPGQRYLVGAIDLVLRDRATGGLVVADLKTTTSAKLGTAGLTVQNAAQLHLYAYMLYCMTGMPVTGLVLVVVSPLYGQARIHTARFHEPLVTGRVYADQRWPLLVEQRDPHRIRRLATAVRFLGDGAGLSLPMAVLAAEAPYVRKWLADWVRHRPPGAPTLPAHWAEADLETTAQWLVAAGGLRRYTSQPWRLSRPQNDREWARLADAVRKLTPVRTRAGSL